MIELRDIDSLVVATRSGRLRVRDVAVQVLDALALAGRPEAWLQTATAEDLLARADALDARRHEAAALALYGVPFAVKDNIDAIGFETTAGCPAFAYRPECDARVVELLLAAGALLVGKTHMDQFATGLVGTRSPYGPCRNAHAAEYISGGSSSGSAVVVAEGIVSFALGTDTAGSGRVPAALNGVFGLKPTRGRVSTSGVVPACASLDCVSIFAATSGDAALVLEVLDRFDESDPWSRTLGSSLFANGVPPSRARSSRAPQKAAFRFGEPLSLPEAYGGETEQLLTRAVAALESIGGVSQPLRFEPFLRTAELLYGGGWTAERDAAFGDFVRANPASVDPVVSGIVTGSAPGARTLFDSLHELQRLRRTTEQVWRDIDVLVLPTVSRPWRIAEVLARPLDASREFGATNNFVNLLDLAAVAVPIGSWSCGVPFGVTLVAPAWSEPLLLELAARLEDATRAKVPKLERPHRLQVAVVGAHLEGMPLHPQLRYLGARLVAKTRTAPTYRLHALANTEPAKPGLEYVGEGGSAIEVEVYALAPKAFGHFVAAVPRPLAIGRVLLEDGSEVSGFVCEPAGFAGAEDISSHGGWRAWSARA